jgi:hypothetical protein
LDQLSVQVVRTDQQAILGLNRTLGIGFALVGQGCCIAFRHYDATHVEHHFRSSFVTWLGPNCVLDLPSIDATDHEFKVIGV